MDCDESMPWPGAPILRGVLFAKGGLTFRTISKPNGRLDFNFCLRLIILQSVLLLAACLPPFTKNVKDGAPLVVVWAEIESGMVGHPPI